MTTANKKDKEVHVKEEPRFLRVDVEYHKFGSSKGPFDPSKKVKSIVDKAISKACILYPIIEREKRCKRSYNEDTGEVSIKIEMDYWPVVDKYTVVNSDYLLMEILVWIDNFITRKLSKCKISKIYYQFIINIDRR